MTEKRRIVITGSGVLAPKAIGHDLFWDLISKGQSGIGPVSIYPMEKYRLPCGGEISDFDPKKMVPNRKSLKVMARDIQIAVGAAKLCMDDSGLAENKMDSTRLGVSMGAGLINTSVQELSFAVRNSVNPEGLFDIQKYASEGMQSLTPLWLLKYLPNMLACHISIQYDSQGPSNTLTTGCAASSHALGEAFRIIERGDADAMIAGGADSKLDPLNWSRFDMIGLLTQNGVPAEKCVRPFDKYRDGFLLAEAAAVFVLEELEHAKKRGAQIYGELVGFGSSCNGSTVLKKVDSKAQQACMKMALEDAGLTIDEIDTIVAHGLGLKDLDRIETEAVKAVFKEKAYHIPVFSFKGSTGYVGAASGSLGLAAALSSIAHQLVPPTTNYEEPDPECDLDYVPDSARETKVNNVMINAFGFIGQNATLIVKAFKE